MTARIDGVAPDLFRILPPAFARFWGRVLRPSNLGNLGYQTEQRSAGGRTMGAFAGHEKVF